MAAALVDADLRLVFSNSAGERLLARGGPVFLRGGRLACSSSQDSAKLRAAMASAAGPGPIGSTVVVTCPRTGESVVLTVSPMNEQDARW